MKTKFTICTLHVVNHKAKITQEEFLANYSTTPTAYEKRHDKPGKPRYIARGFQTAFKEVNYAQNYNRSMTLYEHEMGKFLGRGFATFTATGILAHIVFLGEPPMDQDDYSRILYEACNRVVEKERLKAEELFQDAVRQKRHVDSVAGDVEETYLAASPEFVLKPLGGNQ